MRGRDFLAIARRLADEPTEAHWRAAAGRAYYSLFLETRDRLDGWGFAKVGRDQSHAFVRLKFLYSTRVELREVGFTLEDLVKIRNIADYQIDRPGPYFGTRTAAVQAIGRADRAIAYLDEIEADRALREAAIESIRAGSP